MQYLVAVAVVVSNFRHPVPVQIVHLSIILQHLNQLRKLYLNWIILQNVSKYKNEQFEQELGKSTLSISTALKSVENIMINKKSSSTDGYMLAIDEGLKHVPTTNKTLCLIEMLQIIQKYEERQ